MRARALVCLSWMLAVGGCSVIASPDRDQISDGGAPGEGGSGGSGGGEGGFGADGGTGALGGMAGSGGMPRCRMDDDCDPPDSMCAIAVCNAGTCEFEDLPAGTAIPAQVMGDCKEAQCDAQGGVVQVADAADLPFDNEECTDDVCTGDQPSNPPLPASTPCGNGLLCDGAGQCVGCSTAVECPGMDTECQTKTCTAMVCGFDYQPSGTVLSMQTAGDCKEAQCAALGVILDIDDDLDIPVDNDDCTDDVCNAGIPDNPLLAAGSPCDDGMGGTVCDAAGACVQCISAADCGTTTECQVFACNAGICSSMNTAGGTPLAMQTTGDCKEAQCDGSGGIQSVPLASDPLVDGQECTTDQCNGSTPENPPLGSGTPCSQGGGTFCNGAGSCVSCVVETDCGVDSFCRDYSCSAMGACSFVDTMAGTPTPSQTPGDCKQNQCDGMGNQVPVNDDADVLDDGQQCTADTCSMGVPSNTPVMSGTACSQGTGVICNAIGGCVECLNDAGCTSLVCDEPTGVCLAPTCSDLVKNGVETDIDCGGAACPDCTPGKTCLVNADCTTGLCTAGICQAPAVVSTVPADLATGIALGSTVAVTFNVAMSPATLTGQTTFGACAGSIRVSYDNFASCIPFASAAATMSGGNTVATLTPSPGLAAGVTYKVRVTTAAQGAASDPLGAQFTHVTGFTTVSPSTLRPVTIEQIYGAGGNGGALFTHDFVVLKNYNSTAVTVAGWSIQYASATGSSWLVNGLAGTLGVIPANGYYLLQLASGGAVGAPMPTADATGTTNMAGAAGKVALVAGTTALTGVCPVGGAIQDFVGFGATANCFEGAAPTGAPSTTTAVHRDVAGCVDANDNATDFKVATPAPINKDAPIAICSDTANAVLNETDVPGEADFCNLQFPPATSAAAGQASAPVFGRIFETGTTEAAGASGSVTAQLGYGRTGASPAAQVGWAWVPAPFNIQIGNDDEYSATLLGPRVGVATTYSYTYRFSLDGGASWTYCDVDGAGSNGGLSFSAALLGALTANP